MTTDLRESLTRVLNEYLDERFGYPRKVLCEFDEAYYEPGLRAIEYMARGAPITDDLRRSIGDVIQVLEEAHALLTVPEVHPTVLTSRRMDKNRYVDAATEVLAFPNSSKLMDYHLVTVPFPWVLVVATTGSRDDQRVILNTAYRHPTGRVCIETPAGFMDDNDGADPVVAGKRELLDETGYGAPTRERVIDPHVTALGGVVRTRGAYVLLEGVSLIRPPQLEGHEQQADVRSHLCHWDTVLALIDAGLITSATTKGALLTAARRLGVLGRHRNAL